ncbi:hypothetical protein N7539_001742 [Penicillium diatomitis]|uniref:Prokaryotic-type class I peptide chain release factors domain-containing protein n=1 Tax=Penicillium diatomitis TaxID=2819901 RepID=A0A9W9XHA5_9EURO|nr:uncharacterized protein N7539_001742 [Penicillium diatomitis]KAJ5492996.1 hypothetical protein N7539_001742 [Penicillium diatomitis]
MRLRPQWYTRAGWRDTPSLVFARPSVPRVGGQAAKFASARSSDPLDPQDVELARTWLKAFQSGAQSIPRQLGQISFSRSSGPGGQNVNKSVQALIHLHLLPSHCSLGAIRNVVNSKATLKVPLSALFPLVPPLLHPQLRASRYATERSQALVIQSDESRQQSTNVDACYAKLNQLLISSARDTIPGVTSQVQKDRVTKL